MFLDPAEKSFADSWHCSLIYWKGLESSITLQHFVTKYSGENIDQRVPKNKEGSRSAHGFGMVWISKDLADPPKASWSERGDQEEVGSGNGPEHGLRVVGSQWHEGENPLWHHTMGQDELLIQEDDTAPSWSLHGRRVPFADGLCRIVDGMGWAQEPSFQEDLQPPGLGDVASDSVIRHQTFSIAVEGSATDQPIGFSVFLRLKCMPWRAANYPPVLEPLNRCDFRWLEHPKVIIRSSRMWSQSPDANIFSRDC